MNVEKHLTINRELCKGCGICAAFCPAGALSLAGGKVRQDPEKCVQCGLCELYCPDYAVFLEEGLVGTL